MLTVTINAADAVELAEIPTYFIERLDTNDDDVPWRSQDLLADLTRLTKTVDAT